MLITDRIRCRNIGTLLRLPPMSTSNQGQSYECYIISSALQDRPRVPHSFSLEIAIPKTSCSEYALITSMHYDAYTHTREDVNIRSTSMAGPLIASRGCKERCATQVPIHPTGRAHLLRVRRDACARMDIALQVRPVRIYGTD